jgi:hypothetical protein
MERNDDYGNAVAISFHMRAKILSPEGRELADVVIPTERGDSDLTAWWGRTILPNGEVKELPQSELKAQFLAKTAYGKFHELRGALPGVVPGCVIDYGYTIHVQGYTQSTRVFLQGAWPIRSLSIRWLPDHTRPAAYVLARSEKLPIAAKHNFKSVLVTAHDLDPVPEEPHMPPLDEFRASATFYYTTGNDTPAEYWDLHAKRTESALKSFFGGSWNMKEVVADFHFAPDASLDDKLRTAYAWLGDHVKNTMLLSAEEQEAKDKSKDDKRDDEEPSAKSVLMLGRASSQQLDFLFAGMARALGAEADVVYAVDRTDRFWNASIKSMSQFAYTLVAIHPPGAPYDRPVIVDAGSGLPYGQVPWRATGSVALMCTSKGSVSIIIPTAEPKDNRADTHVALSFSDDNETMLAQWDRRAIGAGGVERRRWLRDLGVRERKEALDGLCGSSGMREITAAELPSLDEPSGPFLMRCDLEQSGTNVNNDAASYKLYLAGPWWPEAPEFAAATRVNPLIFDYPKADVAAIELTAPHGFRPASAPEPIRINSPYGRYELIVKQTPTGFHVDRAFALTFLIANANEYGPLRKFFNDVRDADRSTVLFERVPSAK